MWEKFNKTGQVVQITQKKGKQKTCEESIELAVGCNNFVMGKKRKEKQDEKEQRQLEIHKKREPKMYKEDYYNPNEISEDNDSKFYSIKKMSNQKSKQMKNEFKNAQSPRPNNYKGKYHIDDSSVFDEPNRVAKQIKSMRNIKNTKKLSIMIVTVEWLQIDGYQFDHSYILYEDAR